MSNTSETLPIVCDLSAITAEDRARLLAAVPALFREVEAVHALPDGYAFRFAAAPGRLLALAEFVEHERLCCPFYRFTLEVEPGGGPMWLKLTGGEDVKAFMESVFGDLTAAVENGLIRRVPGEPLEAAVAAAAPVLAEAMRRC